MAGKATSEFLSGLHGAVAKNMQRRIEQSEQEDGTPLSAAEWSAITKFLKDNGVEALVAPDTPLGDLLDSMPDIEEEHGAVVPFPQPNHS